MSQTLVPATPPYNPPHYPDRAWQPDGRDEYALDAMRDGFAWALEAMVYAWERKDPTMAEPAHPDREVIHFRSRRMPRTSRSIDPDIVDRVMAMQLEDIDLAARYRRDHTDEYTNYPRAVLDALAQDIVDAVEHAGTWDRDASHRWIEATQETHVLAAGWLND